MRPTRPAAVGSTIGLKTHISRFDDERGRWQISGTSRPCKSSPPHTPRSTTTSTTTVISAQGPYSKKTAPPPWPSGASWRPKEPLCRDYWRPVRIRLTAPRRSKPKGGAEQVDKRLSKLYIITAVADEYLDHGCTCLTSLRISFHYINCGRTSLAL